ncbi:MAG: hypothetical protein Q9183_001052, partial [Haloplaca sp. 2 TL-2023]
IQRSALRSGSSSPVLGSPDPEEKEQWHKQLEQLYSEENAEAPTSGVSGANTETVGEVGEAIEEAYDFKLFSSKTKGAGSSVQQLPRVLLRSPSPGDAEAGFVRPRRRDDYYYTGVPTLAKLMQYRDAAIEGDDVLKESGSKWFSFMTVLYRSLDSQRERLRRYASSLSPTMSTSSSEVSTSGLESSALPSLSQSAPTMETMPALSQHTLAPVPSSQVSSHSTLGAALGGAFGGITAVALVGLLFYFLRRQKRKRRLEKHIRDDKPRELPGNNPFLPSNLKHKDELPRASEPATELDSQPLDSPIAPYEFHEKGSDVNRKPSPPPRSSKRPSPFHQPASQSDGKHASISPVQSFLDQTALGRRAGHGMIDIDV